MSITESTYDAALGCMLGACIGDAAGAILEFRSSPPDDEDVAYALTMPGGGFFHLAPGQITDDGELTLSLARALSASKTFSIESIARSYAGWIRSRPFDIGNTIYSSIGCVFDAEWEDVCKTHGHATAMARAAQRSCTDSKANGSLMRATPLGIWGHKLKLSDLAYTAREDSSLSHPNKSCAQAVACYAIAISTLINRPGERQTAFDAANEWADMNANAEVCEWLADAAENKIVPYHPQAGFVKIAFTHAFRHLVNGTEYVDALKETLKGGGDADTNACIVGGLIGAACGAKLIPESLKSSILSCDTTKGRHTRPKEFGADQIPSLVERLLENAPDRL